MMLQHKKQYDDLTGQVAVLQKQIAANNTQKDIDCSRTVGI